MIYFIVSILIIIDQLSKFIVVNYIKLNQEISIIDNFFKFTYVRNTGAAFGVLQNQKNLFIIITLIILFLLIYYYEKNKKVYSSLEIKIIYVLIIAGAIGNLIDRIFRGYVVDMLDFEVINYPVFNIADCFVVIGVALLIRKIIFYKENKEKYNKISKDFSRYKSKSGLKEVNENDELVKENYQEKVNDIFFQEEIEEDEMDM